MTTQVFLDECKRDGYTVAAVVLTHGRVDDARRSLRDLLLPGARSVHFQAESDSKRRETLRVIAGIGVEVTIYQAKRRLEIDARLCILERIVHDLAPTGVTRMILERDDSMVVHDVQTLRTARSKAKIEREFTFHHMQAHEEPLLWVPDAVAWAYTKDATWRALVTSVVAQAVVV